MQTEVLLQQAWQALEQGQQQAAETILLQIVSHPGAQFLLGQLYYQQDCYAKAVPHLQGALAARPDWSELYPLLGAALQMDGRPAEALPWYRQALELDPKNPSHSYNLATALKEAGLLQEAAEYFATLLEKHPNHLKARNNYGATLQALGRLEEAADQYQSAVDLAPDYALAWYNLGDLRQRLGQYSAAEYAFQQAVQFLPDEHAAVRARLGRLCQQMGELEASVYWLQQALARSPEDVSLWRSLGASHQALGQWDNAMADFQQALALEPKDTEAHNRLGNLYREQGRMQEAQACFEKVLQLQPSDAQRIRLATITPPVYHSIADVVQWRARIEKQVAALAQSRLEIADPLTEIGQANFYLAYQGYNDRELQQAIAALYRPLLPEQVAAATPRPKGSRRRIGFLSGFFYNHSICHYYSGHILGLDPTQYELYLLLAPGNPSDAATAELMQHVHQTLRLPRSLPEARQRVADLHLDALIYTDIGMEPFSYFMALTRLAPVQVVLPGHPVTTGIPTMDYFISNQPMEIPEAQTHYSETLVTLPGLPVQYRRPELPKTLLSRQALGLPENRHLYLCGMTLFKIHPQMDQAFAQILDSDPKAEILFFKFQHTRLHEILQARFEKHLGKQAQRIRYLPWASRQEFLSLLRTAEVTLDSYPFGGGSTHYLTLATGTPLITWASPWLRGRSGTGIYQELGIPELMTETAGDFATRAVEVACDRTLRDALSARIQAGHSLLFDNPQGPRVFAQWLASVLPETT